MLPVKKLKGDIGAAQVIADLVKKGFIIFTPVVCESLPFDIVAFKEGKFLRIQCKYSSNGTISGKTSWSDKNGNHEKKYSEDDFDYYGIYLPSIDKVVYPSIKFRGAKIATEVGNSATPFYWWEDFQHLTDSAEKKTYKDFNSKIRHSKTEGSIKSRVKSRRVERPSKEELEKMLWEVPTTEIAKSYGVSDTAVSKWAKAYEISKPPRGHWSK